MAFLQLNVNGRHSASRNSRRAAAASRFICQQGFGRIDMHTAVRARR